MKTRTLLLLAVTLALAILLAGGVFLLRLSDDVATVESSALGQQTEVGDVTVTVFGTVATGDPGVLGVEVELGGVDDSDGTDSFRLVTGDRRLEPVTAPDQGRCAAITTAVQHCRIDFDVSGVESPTRVLVMRRGDDQRNWVLSR